MVGSDTNPGVILRSINHLFERFKRYAEWKFEVEISMAEMYTEKIYDLFHVSKELKALNDLTNITKIVVNNELECLSSWKKGVYKRKVCATAGNFSSSRSHMITQLHLKGEFQRQETRTATITLVDLAGSENASTSENMTETKAINKSLSALNGVFAGLKAKTTIDYNSNLLTRILKPNFVGNSKTLLIVNISTNQNDIDSTINTAKFATLN